MIIYQPWWQLIGVLLLITIIAIVFAGLNANEEDKHAEQPADTGSSHGGRQRLTGRLGRSLSNLLSLGLRDRQPAVHSGRIVRTVSGPEACGTGMVPRWQLSGLTAEEEFNLQRYLHLVRHTAGAVNLEDWSISDAVHEIAGLRAMNTPEGRATGETI